MQNAFVQTIEQTVRGLGYDLIEAGKSQKGLLGVTIDWPYTPSVPHPVVTLADCEKVTRQLQYVLEVEGVEYQRLEVGSPGIDRRLRHDADLARFVGYTVDVVLKEAIAVHSKNAKTAQRRKFRGVLRKAEESGWELHWSDGLVSKSGGRPPPGKDTKTCQVLGFVFEELQTARLAPMVDFKSAPNTKPGF